MTIDPNKLLHIIDFDSCNYITSIECISFLEETIPPMLLISRVNILYKWCQHNDLDGDIVIGIIETGYANNDTT